YGQGWNVVGATTYLGTTGASLKGVTGLFYGDSKQLIAQIIETVVCIGWDVGIGGLCFFIIRKLVGHRRSPRSESARLDVPEMGVPGYPEYVTPKLPSDIAPAEIEAAKMSA